MRAAGKDGIALLGILYLTLLACGLGESDWTIEIPEDECADDPLPAPQPLPSACATVAHVPDVVIGTDDGWLLAGFSHKSALSGDQGPLTGNDGGLFLERTTVSVRTTTLSPDGTPSTATSVEIGERRIFSEQSGFAARAFTLAGDVLVAAIGRDLVGVEARGAGPSFRDLASDVPDAVKLVALDATRVAAFGIDRLGTGAPARPMVRVYDVASATTLSSLVYAFGAAAWWYPEVTFFWDLGTQMPALEVVRLDTDRLLVAWVAESRREIQAVEVDANGAPLGEPTTLATAGTDLFTPRIARISDTELGMVWTGDSGLEVRFRSLPTDLTGVRPESGTIVNATRRCSQEHARIASAPGGGALVVWETQTPGPLQGRFISLGARVTLDPPDSDLSPSACSRNSDRPTLASGPHGMLLAWPESGFTGTSRTVVAKVSR